MIKSAGFVATFAGTVRNRTSLDVVLRNTLFGLAAAMAGPIKPEELRLKLVCSGGEVLSVVESCGLGRLRLL
jgi:NADH:ubiquinone oxidoreductase subunit F (NADH-binding)